MFFGKKRKEINELNKLNESAEKSGAVNSFVKKIANSTDDEVLQGEIFKLYDSIRHLPTINSAISTSLDEVIFETIECFHEGKLVTTQIFDDEISKLKAAEYKDANREIFGEVAQFLTSQISLRQKYSISIDNPHASPEKRKAKELENQERLKQMAEKAEVEKAFLKFTIENLAVIYERQILEKINDALVKKAAVAKTDAERDRLKQKFAQNKKEMEQLAEQSKRLAKAIENNQELKLMMGSANIGELIKNSQAGKDMFLSLLHKKTSEAIASIKAEENINEGVDEMRSSYKDASRSIKSTTSSADDEFDKLVNQHKAMAESVSMEDEFDKLIKKQMGVSGDVDEVPPKGDKL